VSMMGPSSTKIYMPPALTSKGEIYVPPAIQEGLKGRDDNTREYCPYSPREDNNKMGYWPKKADKKEEVEQRDDVIKRAQDALRRTQTSDDERYHPEYRGMPDGSYLSDVQSGSTESDEHDDYSFDVESRTDSRTTPPPTPKRSARSWYRNSLPFLSKSASESTDHTCATGDSIFREHSGFGLIGSSDNGDYVKTIQDVAYCTIALTSIQLLILMLQLTMCGFAPFDINPMIGPFPDAFSQWGGKNPYLMLHDNEWWRMVTPALLHVGVLHLIANAFCQLIAVAMFEREWGWFKWVFVYIMSTIGCSASSNWFDPDTIAVGSSGSLMGVFAAKLAQVVIFSFFETNTMDADDVIRLDQLSSVLLGLTLVSLLGSFTYIDWSGNMGGLLAGFLAGVIIFTPYIDGCCWRFWCATLGLVSLFGSLGYVMYLFIETSEPDEQLADVCEYFRSFFPEGYECGCLWE
jgi:membrane associated rhomboid family serine protease